MEWMGELVTENCVLDINMYARHHWYMSRRCKMRQKILQTFPIMKDSPPPTGYISPALHNMTICIFFQQLPIWNEFLFGGRIYDSWQLICRNWVKDLSPYCNCLCFLLCTMLISILCGPVHVCNYIRFRCLFAFTVIIIPFTVTTLWTCPISFCNDF
jgi:hypothetical protein